MKKSSFVALILGVIGGLFFALGMCMALLPEWGMSKQGIAAGVVGAVILLADFFNWRRMEGKEPIKVSPKTIGTVVVSIVGALLLGLGMFFTMVAGKMMLGVVVGIVGIVVLLLLIPLTKGLRD